MYVHVCPTLHSLWSLTGVCILQKYFTKVFYKSILPLVEYKYLKCCSKDSTVQDLILGTRLCGTGFIPQHCWVADFHLTKMVRRNFFVPGLYQLWKGKSAGLALEYFYMIHRVGRIHLYVYINTYMYICIYICVYIYIYI